MSDQGTGRAGGADVLLAKARSAPPLGKHDNADLGTYSRYVVALPGADA